MSFDQHSHWATQENAYFVLYQLLPPVNDVVEPLLVACGDVASQEPAVGSNTLFGSSWVVQVSLTRRSRSVL